MFPACSGSEPVMLWRSTNDRVGRMLDRLFDADRATLVTETVPVGDPQLRRRCLPASQRLDDRHLHR